MTEIALDFTFSAQEFKVLGGFALLKGKIMELETCKQSRVANITDYMFFLTFVIILRATVFFVAISIALYTLPKDPSPIL